MQDELFLEVKGVILSIDFNHRSKKRGKPNEQLVLTLRVEAVEPPSDVVQLEDELRCQRKPTPGDRALRVGQRVIVRTWAGHLGTIPQHQIYDMRRVE